MIMGRDGVMVVLGGQRLLKFKNKEGTKGRKDENKIEGSGWCSDR